MPLPAGTGLTRRRFVVGGLGAALAVYGGSQLGLRAFEEGIAAAASGPAAPVFVSVFLEGGADGLSVLSPQGYSGYTGCGPLSRSPEARRSPRTPASSGIRRSTVSEALCGEEGHRSSRRRLHASRPVPLHVTALLGGRRDRRGSPDRLARPLPRQDREVNNPLQGLSLDDALAPALATAKMPVASISAPDDYSFYSNRVWGEVEQRMLEAIGLLGNTHDDAGLRTAAARLEAGRPRCAASSSRSSRTRARSSTRPRRRVPEAARRARGDARSGAAAPLRRADGSRLVRHAHERGGRALRRAAAHLRLAPRVPARPRGAWPRRSRARARLDGVRAAGRGERRRGNRPRRGRDGIPHRLARHRDDGRRVPGLGTGLDSDGNLVETADFRGVYASLLEQWFSVDAAAVIPNASSFSRYALIA